MAARILAKGGGAMAKKKPRSEPKIVRPDDINPHHDWKRPLQAPGPHPGRLRAADRLPPPARLPPGAHARRALGLRAGGAVVVRSAQHPLHHQHGDRRVGARQAHPLFALDRQRRSLRVGLRLGRAPPQDARALAAPRPLPRRAARHARRDRRGPDAVSRRGEGDQGDPGRGGRGRHAARPGRGRAADAVRAAEGGHHGARRAAGDAAARAR